MKRVCQFCRVTYGEKEPFEDERETTGSCDLCHWLWMLWWELYREKMVDDNATDFILECRKAFGEVSSSPILECDLTGPQIFDSLPGGARNLNPATVPIKNRSCIGTFSRKPGDVHGISAERTSNQVRHGCVYQYLSD